MTSEGNTAHGIYGSDDLMTIVIWVTGQDRFVWPRPKAKLQLEWKGLNTGCLM